MSFKLALATLSCLTLACSSVKLEQGAPGTDAECRGPGRYEAGKEGSYKPCCAGLKEVPYLKQGFSDTGPVCVQVPLNVYACVEGSCGDGICEEGEAPACGCVADCPGAAWGPQDAGADAPGE